MCIYKRTAHEHAYSIHLEKERCSFTVLISFPQGLLDELDATEADALRLLIKLYIVLHVQDTDQLMLCLS